MKETMSHINKLYTQDFVSCLPITKHPITPLTSFPVFFPAIAPHHLKKHGRTRDLWLTNGLLLPLRRIWVHTSLKDGGSGKFTQEARCDQDTKCCYESHVCH